MDMVIQRPTAGMVFGRGGTVDFTVQLLAERNWSLAGFYGAEGLRDKPELARDLRELFLVAGAQRVYAPTPVEFNAKILKPEVFTTVMRLDEANRILMLRNKERPADGTFLRYMGDAGVFSAGGCPTIVATYKREMVFAHAGQDCLLDRARVDSLGEKRSRPNESVVDSIMDALKEESFEFERFNPADVHVWVYGSIRPEDFGHSLLDPKYGQYNGKLYAYVHNRFSSESVCIRRCEVQLDLPVIIQKQFMERGVRGTQINLTDAYLPSNFPTTRNGLSSRYVALVVRTS